MLNLFAAFENFNIPWLSNQSIANTLLLVVMAILGRFLLVRMIKGRGGVLSDSRRRWVSVVQNSTILFLVLGFIFIWSPQLSTFALSLTAFAVALVVATKEYILCMVGAIYRATSNPFAVGDWIEIQNFRGEVLTEGFLTTKLQELGSGSARFKYTGRILTLPNSLLLTQTVYNEQFRKYHLHHSFKVTVEPGIDPTKIISAALPLLAPPNADAEQQLKRSWEKISKKAEIKLPSRDPKITVETSDIGKIIFSVTVFASPADAANYEAKITQFILSETSLLK